VSGIDKLVVMEHGWNNTVGKTEVPREKPFLLPLCSPPIPHGLAWD